MSDSRDRPPARRITQYIQVSDGVAYGAVDGDIHVFGDGTAVGLLTHQPVNSRPADIDLSALGDLRAWRSSSQRLAVRWLHADRLECAAALATEFATDSAAARWLVLHAVRDSGASSQCADPGPGPKTKDRVGTLLVLTGVDDWQPSQIAWALSNRILYHDTPARVLLVAATDARWPAVRATLAHVQASTSSQHLQGGHHHA